jgi:hypothetical protein
VSHTVPRWHACMLEVMFPAPEPQGTSAAPRTQFCLDRAVALLKHVPAVFGVAAV